MQITLAPDVPSRADPTNFPTKGDAFLAWLANLAVELNAYLLGLMAGFQSTSVTSLTIGTGTKALTVAAELGIFVGMDVVIARTSDGNTRMQGVVTSYDDITGALAVNVTSSFGSGTYTDWTVSICTSSDSAVFATLTGIQTLTNKTLTSPVLNTPTLPTPLSGASGGTGVNNSTRTLTYGGNVAFTGAFDVGFTVPGAFTYSLPNVSCLLASEQLRQVSQSAAYTLVLADAGKQIFHPSADTTARTWTIPANSSVAFPIGTAIVFVNQASAGVLTISITTDTMRLAGTGTTGSRTLAANGIATALKVTATEWLISGTGLT